MTSVDRSLNSFPRSILALKKWFLPLSEITIFTSMGFAQNSLWRHFSTMLSQNRAKPFSNYPKIPQKAIHFRYFLTPCRFAQQIFLDFSLQVSRFELIESSWNIYNISPLLFNRRRKE
jgi:hypothetical protein